MVPWASPGATSGSVIVTEIRPLPLAGRRSSSSVALLFALVMHKGAPLSFPAGPVHRQRGLRPGSVKAKAAGHPLLVRLSEGYEVTHIPERDRASR